MSRISTPAPGAIRATRRTSLQLLMILGVAVGLLSMAAQPAQAAGACSDTAIAAFNACKSEVKDDYWEAVGICFNSDEVDDCLAEASEERFDGRAECGEQLEARREICDELGEDPYDPSWNGGDFEAPVAAGGAGFDNENPYLPLKPGNEWVYEDGEGEETITVTVLDEYKLIDGVWCIVVNDTGEVEEEEKEDTDDWMALSTIDGSVHYCGEISQDFEYMEDDLPAGYELVEIEGSWKTGRDGAKSGILMPGDPADYLGEFYRQEWAFGDAEDMGEMVATGYSFGEEAISLGEGDEDYEGIDEAIESADFTEEQETLLTTWCDLGAGCVVTRDFTPIEPDVEEYKFYADGIGLVLEIDPDPEEGGFVILVECNVDPACPSP